MVELSSNLLLAAFFIYIFATIAFSITIYYENSKSVNKTKRWGRISFGLACAGFLAQLGYFVTSWIAAGHAPVSNMFEYTTFLGLTILFAFLILYLIYKKPVLGIFSMPVGNCDHCLCISIPKLSYSFITWLTNLLASYSCDNHCYWSRNSWGWIYCRFNLPHTCR